MNYCTINGKKSTLIKGLLIQSLPPISKPLIRTQVEEIDGRDGDIITPLGYSAYNKPMEIGLYGDYDIDDVIEYFNSEGTVTFSNEPDKYYEFQIIEQIDFERLIRYKTATVTFHVQPFKYSTVDDVMIFNNTLLTIPNYTETKNGITITAQGGEITIEGTASKSTEFYVPISALKLGAGNYELSATTSGTGSSACSMRVISQIPSNEDSLGGKYVSLEDNETVTIDAEQLTTKIFRYLWFYVSSGTAMNFTLGEELTANQFSIINSGNTVAKPTMTIHGDGDVDLSLNGNQIFAINITNGEITINVAEMQAYIGEIFLNRYVTGNYDNLLLKMGKNTIAWTGNVSKIEIEQYSRWI